MGKLANRAKGAFTRWGRDALRFQGNGGGTREGKGERSGVALFFSRNENEKGKVEAIIVNLGNRARGGRGRGSWGMTRRTRNKKKRYGGRRIPSPKTALPEVNHSLRQGGGRRKAWENCGLSQRGGRELQDSFGRGKVEARGRRNEGRLVFMRGESKLSCRRRKIGKRGGGK